MRYVDKAMYYCFSYNSTYNGFLDQNNHSISPAWYPFKAFGKLYALKDAVETKCEGNIYAQGATDGQNNLLMISNYNSEEEKTAIRLDGINGKKKINVLYCADGKDFEKEFSFEIFEKSEIEIKVPKHTVVIITDKQTN